MANENLVTWSKKFSLYDRKLWPPELKTIHQPYEHVDFNILSVAVSFHRVLLVLFCFLRSKQNTFFLSLRRSGIGTDALLWLPTKKVPERDDRHALSDDNRAASISGRVRQRVSGRLRGALKEAERGWKWLKARASDRDSESHVLRRRRRDATDGGHAPALASSLSERTKTVWNSVPES